jgi:16S rRNA (guanine527-N7)-methyltransferase
VKRESPSSHVSRETKKHSALKFAPEPEAIGADARERVARWLGEIAFRLPAGFLDRIERLAATLALWGRRTNLTSKPDDAGEIAFHVIDSLAPFAFAPDEARSRLDAVLHPEHGRTSVVRDIGSGAGFPGLVIAAAFECRFILVESRRMRASFLEVATREMGLGNVVTEPRRLGRGSTSHDADLVTVRAFGGTTDLYAIASAALRPTGLLMVYASAGQNIDNDAARRSGFACPTDFTYRLVHSAREIIRATMIWRKDDSLRSKNL